MSELAQPVERRNGLGIFTFFCTLFALALLRVILGLVAVPLSLVPAATIVSTIVFIAAPIFALYYAAQHSWTGKTATAFLIVGLLIQFGLGMLVYRSIVPQQSFAAAVIVSIAVQVGLPTWCVALGALLALLLKDRNLLIPVSIFLAAFDIFLVLTPLGPTKQIMQAMPEIIKQVGYSVPQPTANPTSGPVQPFAFIGPADFLFMGMFFVALYKFRMRSKQTVLWLVPAILVYLLFTVFLGPIPLLVPIGLTVLIVNAREFKMNKEEKISTIAVGILGILIIAGSIALRNGQPAPSQRGRGPASSISANSPPPAVGH